MSNRDASSKSNGYFYQRRYGVYLLLVNNNIEKIIEEGNIDNNNYEDITIIFNNKKKSTYQIKHKTSSAEGLCASSNIMKTIANEDNMKLDNIHYITCKKNNETNYSENLKKWKDKDISMNDIYNIITTFECGKSDACKKAQELFKKYDKNIIINYLSKYIIEDGLIYKDLAIKTDEEIRKILPNYNDSMITFTRLLLYEKFTDNSFNKNFTMTKKDIYEYILNNLNLKFEDESENKCKFYKKIISKLSDTKNDLYNDDIELIIEDFSKILGNIEVTDENLKKYKLEQIINICYDLKSIYDIRKDIISDKIKDIYTNYCDLMVYKILEMVDNKQYQKKLNIDDYKYIISAINTYKNHNIENQINIKRSKIWKLLCNGDKEKIENNKREKVRSKKDNNKLISILNLPNKLESENEKPVKKTVKKLVAKAPTKKSKN